MPSLYESISKTLNSKVGRIVLIVVFWSALPDLNRSPVSDEAFVLLRELSRQCLEEIQRGRTATTRQLLSMLAEVRG